MPDTLNDLAASILRDLLALSPWEGAAVVLAIAYLVLAIRQNPWCWAAALVSAMIFGALMVEAGLLMQGLLQVFYMGMAIYGWRRWTRGDDTGRPLAVTSWTLRQQAPLLLGVLIVGGANGWLLQAFTDAAWPWLDALTAWAAIVATWLVAQKVLQNWHWWFVIDGVSAFLYGAQGLALTALLFMAYLVLIVIGYRSWRRDFRAHG